MCPLTDTILEEACAQVSDSCKIAEVLLAKPATSVGVGELLLKAGALLTSNTSCIHLLRVEKNIILTQQLSHL